MDFKQKEGFTLLEVIIVIIIVGVLASLALPRFLRVIESSRSAEALANITMLRQAIERCYVMRGGDYSFCKFNVPLIPNMMPEIDDPGLSPNAHFTYVVNGLGSEWFYILATRNTLDGGNPSDHIICHQQDPSNIFICGTGAFSGIGGPCPF